MIKTYLDSGILIAAARGTDIASSRSILILDDDQRQFCSSCFVRLEILAKAKYQQQQGVVIYPKRRLEFSNIERYQDLSPSI